MSDTGVAKLPGLPAIQLDNPALQRWVQAVAERLEVREGQRGNPAERAVTQRELDALLEPIKNLKSSKGSKGDLTFDLGGGMSASIAIDEFIAYIKNLQLYKDLIRRLDDPERFNDLPLQVRTILLNDIAEEAAKRGADIRRVEQKYQSDIDSLAYRVEEVTAAVQGASAGVRDLTFAYANTNRAQAGEIKQMVAALTGYYGDGSTGKATLETVAKVSADRQKGLFAEYTVKLEAGGAVAGFGLAASESVSGERTSAFLIRADKFALVGTQYTGGPTPTPDDNLIPFGVDTTVPPKLYMRANVYIDGAVRIKTPSGSYPISNVPSRASIAMRVQWPFVDQDKAQTMVLDWVRAANTNLPANGKYPVELVIGDSVTFYALKGTYPAVEPYEKTIQWAGYGWYWGEGVTIDGNLLINGSVAANKIDTHGLEIRDKDGKLFFSSGVSVDFPASFVSGLGALALKNTADIGDATSTVKVNGQTLLAGDFVNKLYKINDTNISTFISSGAIGNAYIGRAAIKEANIDDLSVSTLKIGANAVTVPFFGIDPNEVSGSNTLVTLPQTLKAGTLIMAIASCDTEWMGNFYGAVIEITVFFAGGYSAGMGYGIASINNAGPLVCQGSHKAAWDGDYHLMVRVFPSVPPAAIKFSRLSVSGFGGKR